MPRPRPAVNLAALHVPEVSSLAGPAHGRAYLTVIAAVWFIPAEAASGAKWRAVVPGIGGLLALRHLNRGVAEPASTPPPNDP
ncbi:hypothetical protein GCM10009799_23410 [Nocardiopsis rhodophaea]|uniref:DUF3817 domain-containing protein n=1 Tax=Nocardiopsis rhodophaea TaxID=280238 RepID=A0ABP5EHG3_9ACTN